MKKAYTALALAFLLALSLCTPAMAAMEYGVIYDETESLGSQELTMQGEQTLPQISQALGLDLRVDVLTQNSYDGLGAAAAGIYEEYDYGYGEHKEGVTLTILLEPQDGDTYRMVDENDWCVYTRLSDERGSGQEVSDAVYDAVQPYMAARAWNGEDMTMSAVALTQAVDAMAETAEEYIRTNCPPAGSGEVPVWKNRCRAASRCSMYLMLQTFFPMRSGKSWRLGPKLFPKSRIAAFILLL